MSENEQITEERNFWRKAAAIVAPDHRPYGWDYKRAATINTPSGQYELVGFIAERLIDLSERAEDQGEALKRISDWANAYPVEAFPDQDLKRATDVLAAAGISMSAMHGQWARHLIGGIGKIAKEALAQIEQPKEKTNVHP